MRVEGALLVVAAAAAVLGLAAAHFPHPGSFHNIMMMIGKKDGTQRLSWKGPTKMARIAPSPHRMWAIIDPPGSLGSLSDESIHTNRIARSLKSIDETLDNMESPSPSRVVRSLSNRREAREEDEAVTEASEEVTEAPEVITEAPEEEVVEEEVVEEEVVEEEVVEEEAEEEEVVEVETEPPVTTPAPVVCGGDLSVTLDPNNLPTDAEGRILHEHILSPGFEDGQYPDQDFDCEWTIGVGTECQMGMLMFMVNEGEIRETARCEEDHLAVSYRGEQESKFCGMLKQGQHQVTGTDIWTEPTPLAMKLSFRASERSASSSHSAGNPHGFNMTISCYCWIWTPEFLAQTTSSTTTTTTTTPITITTTEAPSEEPVTSISEDGQGYVDEVIEEEDTATEAPQGDGFDDSGERFFDIPNDLESIDDISDPLVHELSSTSSVESLSPLPIIPGNLVPAIQDDDILVPELSSASSVESLSPLPIIPGNLVPAIQDDDILVPELSSASSIESFSPLTKIPGNLIPTSQDDDILVPELSSASSIESLSPLTKIPGNLIPTSQDDDILVPELSSASSIESLSPLTKSPGNLVPTSQDDNILVPELSSASSVESLSSLPIIPGNLVPTSQDENILVPELSSTSSVESLSSLPIIPGNLVPTSQDENILVPELSSASSVESLSSLPIIPGNLIPTSQDDNILVPELSSASSVESLSSSASLISDLPLQEDANIVDPEIPNTDMINTENISPIVPEAELLPLVPVQPGSLPIIPGYLVPTSQDENPLVPELSSASSVEILSSIASLIPDLPLQEGPNILDKETPNTDVINTESLSPIVPEAELLPFVPVQPGPLPIIPGNLVPTSQDDESILNTTPEEEDSSSSAISSLENTDSKVSEQEEPIPVDTKPVPIDSNPQVEKPKPNNSNKPSGANKPNKKPNKNKPTKPKPPTSFIPIKPLRDDSNLMGSDIPYIGEKINFEPIINQLLAQ